MRANKRMSGVSRPGAMMSEPRSARLEAAGRKTKTIRASSSRQANRSEIRRPNAALRP